MALKIQASFSTGELDPALHERTTLDKYHSGLATARNVLVGRTGRLISRHGRRQTFVTKLASKTIIFSPPNTNVLLEFGVGYARLYNLSTGLQIGADVVHALTADDLSITHFTNDAGGSIIYVWCLGKAAYVILYSSLPVIIVQLSTLVPSPSFSAPTFVSNTVTGTGYDLDYVVTSVQGGQESVPSTVSATGKMPINPTESNIIIFDCHSGATTEMRVYRRPRGGGAFGFVGSSSANTSGTQFTFTDIGGAADYTHSPPSAYSPPTSGIGTIYQQRLIVASGDSVYASVPGFKYDFRRNYPLDAASSLNFKFGSNGVRDIYHMIDSDGLLFFTNVGVFLHEGELTPTNLSANRKGNWVIDQAVPPLAVPGGVLFMDSKTKTVRVLSWSTEFAAYMGEELSIFNNHLFSGKQVTSWAFHDGDVPVLWVTYDDGSFSAFTYERNQQMKAWTRHDFGSNVGVEYVCGTGLPDQVYFVVNKNGQRYIECTIPRYVSGTTKAADTEWYMNESIAAMDALKSYKSKFNDGLGVGDKFTISPTSFGGAWDGDLYVSCVSSSIFNVGSVGRVIRYFNPDDGSSVDLTITQYISAQKVQVSPSCEFPSDKAVGPNLYLASATFTGLDHLEGEDVSIIVDGAIVSSPNNDQDNYPIVTVTGGSITLPNGMLGAIVHVGRPYTMDIETLDIDTVEQRPTLLESQTVNKVYIKTLSSRGLFVGNTLPTDDSVGAMENLDTIDVDYENVDDIEVLGNRFQAPVTKRYEVTLPGSWKSNGRVCLRQVDPIHFEILSISPDDEDLRR